MQIHDFTKGPMRFGGRASNIDPNEFFDFEEDRESLLRRLGQTAVSGVARLGNLMDVSASSIRDILALRNPLDQWVPGPIRKLTGMGEGGWTTSDRRTSGRDLLRQYGMAGDKDTWGNFTAGLLLETGTDPLTYITGPLAAATKSAKVLKASGLMHKTKMAALSSNAKRRLVTGAARKVGSREYLKRSSLKDFLEDLKFPEQGLPDPDVPIPGRAMQSQTSLAYEDTLKGLAEELERAGDKLADIPGYGTTQSARNRYLRQNRGQVAANAPAGAATEAFWKERAKDFAEATQSEKLGRSFRVGLPSLMDPAYWSGKKGAYGIGTGKAFTLPDSFSQNLDNVSNFLGGWAPTATITANLSRPVSGAHTTEMQDIFRSSYADGIRNDARVRLASAGFTTRFEKILKNIEDRATTGGSVRAAKAVAKLKGKGFHNFVGRTGFRDEYFRHYVDQNQIVDLVSPDELEELKTLFNDVYEFDQSLRNELESLGGRVVDDRTGLPIAGNLDDTDTGSPRFTQEEGFDPRKKNDLGEVDIPTDRSTSKLLKDFNLENVQDIHGQTGVAHASETGVIQAFASDPELIAIREASDSIRASNLDASTKMRRLLAKKSEWIRTFRRKYGSVVPDTYYPQEAKSTELVQEAGERAVIKTTETRYAPRNYPGNAPDAGHSSLVPAETGRHKKLAQMLLSDRFTVDQLKSGLFPNHPLADYAIRWEKMANNINKVKTLRDTISHMGVQLYHHGTDLQTSTSDIAPTMATMLEEMGMHVGHGTVDNPGFMGAVLREQGVDLSSLGPDWLERGGKQWLNRRVNKKYYDDLVRMRKSFDAPEDLKRVIDVMDHYLAVWKGWMTGPFPSFHGRNLVSGQIQNFLAGMFSAKSVNNAWRMMHGKEVQGAKDWPIVRQIARQSGIAAADLNDEVATELLRNMAYANRVVTRHAGLRGALDTNEGQPGDFESLMLDKPGKRGYRWSEVGKKFAGDRNYSLFQRARGQQVRDETLPGTGWISPATDVPVLRDVHRYLDTKPAIVRWPGKFAAELPGFPAQVLHKGTQVRSSGSKAAKTQHAAIAAGEELGYMVEGMNRLSPWLHQLQRNVDATEAAQQVGAAQVLYSSKYYTETERAYLNRMFPFYKFSSRSIPFVVKNLINHPGGAQSQLLRMTRLSQPDDRPLPEAVSETAGIPLTGMFGPKVDDGTQRFLTGFGLMPEDAWQFLGPLSSGNVKNAVLEGASRAHPFAKFAFEGLSGQSLFSRGGPFGTGRPLRQMDPPMQRLASNLGLAEEPEPGGANFGMAEMAQASLSPTSRLVTELRKLTDPRKGIPTKLINALTGARITDVTPGQMDAVVRNRLIELMEAGGARHFTRTYYKTADLDRMEVEDPQAYVEAMHQQSLLNYLADVSKQRAEEKAKRNLLLERRGR